MLDYYNALERLKKSKPNILKKGYKISKASVAMEAGRDPSAIKSSRPEFARLIIEIAEAANKRIKPAIELKARYDKMRISRDNYKLLYEESLARELCLIRRINELEFETRKVNS
jgi:hypothetical protein